MQHSELPRSAPEPGSGHGSNDQSPLNPSLIRIAQEDTDIPPPPEPANGQNDTDWSDVLSNHGESVLDTPPEVEQEWIGRRLGVGGRYEILGRIGRGGMGRVYEALDANRSGTRVAIKIPLQRLLSVPGLRDRFEREYRSLIQLQHPHICQVIDTGDYEGTPFFVLQFLGQGHLASRYFQDRPGEGLRTVAEMFRWLRPISAALDFMHRQNFVHRDIKPENILFDDEGHAFLSDFGIVRAIRAEQEAAVVADTSLTQHGAWLGTPGYIAPEAMLGTGLDGRADLYALAAITYLFLTDSSPFPGETSEAIRMAQISSQPVHAHELDASIPEAVSKVLASALARDPDQRPATCARFVSELEAAFQLSASAAAAEPSSVPPGESVEGPTGRKILSSPWMKTTGVALMVLVLGLAGQRFGSLFRPSANSENDASAAGAFSSTTNSGEQQAEQGDMVQEAGGNDQSVRRERLAILLSNAATYLADGQHEAALDEYQAAIELDGERLDYLIGQARAYQGLQFYQQSLDLLDQILAIEPRPDAQFERGRCHLAMQQVDAAERDFRAAIASDPGEPTYHFFLGLVLHARQQWPEAIDAYTRAIDSPLAGIPSRDRASWFNARATARLTQGDNSEALSDVTEAIRLDDSVARYFINRAILYRQLRRDSEATADEARARQINGAP